MWYTTRQGTGIEIKTAITITFVHHSLVKVSLVIIYNVNVCFIGGSIVHCVSVTTRECCLIHGMCIALYESTGKVVFLVVVYGV
jgi:hypothetical protein